MGPNSTRLIGHGLVAWTRHLKQDVRIRSARQEDREKVVPFCTGTFDWGDYIDEVFDLWVKDQEGSLLVADVDGQPAGILHVRLMKHGWAWLEGLRVDPRHRRAGLATALNLAALSFLKERGYRNVRLFIEANNLPSMQLAYKLGFTEAFRWKFYHGRRPVLAESRYSSVVGREKASETWDRLDGSDLFSRLGRCYEMSWAMHPLEREDFIELVDDGRVFRSGSGEDMALVISGPEEGHPRALRACFLMGSPKMVKDLASFVLRKALRQGFREVRASSPDQPEVVAGLRSARFRPGFSTTLVYTMDLRGLRP